MRCRCQVRSGTSGCSATTVEELPDINSFVGVDIDGGGLKVLRAYFNACYAFGKEAVRVYRTRRGYHIVISSPELSGVVPDGKVAIRRYLGDDEARLFCTEFRRGVHGEYLDILFEVKWVGGKRYEREETSVLHQFWQNHICVRRYLRVKTQRETSGCS